MHGHHDFLQLTYAQHFKVEVWAPRRSSLWLDAGIHSFHCRGQPMYSIRTYGTTAHVCCSGGVQHSGAAATERAGFVGVAGRVSDKRCLNRRRRIAGPRKPRQQQEHRTLLLETSATTAGFHTFSLSTASNFWPGRNMRPKWSASVFVRLCG